MSFLNDFRDFCYSEARVLRGLGRSLNINPDANPKSSDILIATSNRNPVIYVIWQGGSVADGFSVITLDMYYEFMTTQVRDKKLTDKLSKNIRHFSPDEIGNIQSFDPDWLTDNERHLLTTAGFKFSSSFGGGMGTPIWAFEQDLIDRRKEKAEKKAQEAKEKERKELLAKGVVIHKEPTIDSAAEERVKKMLVGNKEEEEKKETPEEKVKRILGDDASRATDKSVASDADRVRQHIAKQNMQDILAARKAAREAGQEIPLSTRRRRF